MKQVGQSNVRTCATACPWSVACFVCVCLASNWAGTTSWAQKGKAPAIAAETPSQSETVNDSASGAEVERWRARLTVGGIDRRRTAAIQTRQLASELRVQLLPVFAELLEHEKDGQIRLALFDTLTAMGADAQDAVPALLTSMRQKFGGRHDEETHQDYRAALTLASIGGPAVEGLKGLLSEESVGLRAEAAMALGLIGAAAEPAIPALVSLLGDNSERVQRDVVTALGRIGEAAMEPLLETVRHEAVLVRANALAALGNAAPYDLRVSNLVQTSLHDDRVEIRRVAARLLAIVKLPDATLEKCWFACLADEDEDISAVSVSSLMQRASLVQKHRAELAKLLVGKNDSVAWHAAFLLQSLGVDAVPLLLEAAKDPASRLEQLARALSLIETPLEPVLYEALSSPVPRSRQAAALALGKIRPLKMTTVEQLVARLEQNDDETQAILLQSLSSLGARSQAALPVVRSLMQHQSAAVRMQVIQILSHAATRDEQLIRDLNGFLQDAEPEVQHAAIDSLRALGPLGGKSIPAVTQSLGNRSPEVREAALDFLGSHGLAASSSVSRLQQELAQGGDTAWRIAILKTLAQIGEGARPVYGDLVKLLDDQDAKVREASLQALSSLRLDLDQLQPHLLRALKDPDANVQAQVSNSIRRLGARSAKLVPALIELLQDTATADKAQELLERLQRFPTEASTIPALLELVAHDNSAVQLHAIRFLGLAGTVAQPVVDQLRPYLQSDNEALRDAAEQAIDTISGAKE